VSLLTLPQTDGPDDDLPQGEERSEQFVLEVSEYFERLDVRLSLSSPEHVVTSLLWQSIQVAIRSSLAHIRQSRIAASAINAPPHGFVPPSLGVTIPTDGAGTGELSLGLQEERAGRDAWVGILNALTRLKAAREREEPGSTGDSQRRGVNMDTRE